MRRFRSALVNFGLFLLPFLLVEGAFRLLPVSQPPLLMPVNVATPVARFEPNVAYRYSRDWNFSIVTHKRSNNYGFVQAADFDPGRRTPLMAVIGDSFVEANTVNAGEAFTDLLHAGVRGRGRVYAFGMSGAPLSQYLAYADYARRSFRPDAMAFVIIGNDFDESLLKYKDDPRFHYFDEGGALRRVDYRLSAWKRLLRSSAFVRYALHNLEAVQRLQMLAHTLSGEPYLSRMEGEALDRRLADSQRAVDLFLAQLPEKSGLEPRSVLFVLDGVRPALYDPAMLAKVDVRHHARMRRYFAARAAEQGYAVLDLQPVFIERHQRLGQRFEAAPTDSHWNALAHRLVAEELRKTPVWRRLFDTAAAELLPVKLLP